MRTQQDLNNELTGVLERLRMLYMKVDLKAAARARSWDRALRMIIVINAVCIAINLGAVAFNLVMLVKRFR